MDETRSWRAVVIAGQGHLLLGERKIHGSPRFEKEHHAEAFAHAVTRKNMEVGRLVSEVKLLPSTKDPEILGAEIEIVH